MNPTAILALLSSLYEQLVASEQRCEALQQEIAAQLVSTEVRV